MHILLGSPKEDSTGKRCWLVSAASLDLKDYTLERNGRFGRLLLDAELAAAAGRAEQAVAPAKQQANKVLRVSPTVPACIVLFRGILLHGFYGTCCDTCPAGAGGHIQC